MENAHWKIEALYRKKTTLQKTAAVGDGIMAQQNANRDNAEADEIQPNDTPERLRRNDNAANKTSTTVEAEKPGHPRTSDRDTRGNKRPTEPTICQEDRKGRNNTAHSSTSTNAGRNETKPIWQAASVRNNARIPTKKKEAKT